MSYQDDDRAIIDYGETGLPGTHLRVRGPLPRNLERGGFITAIGAAQTFGRFVERPFPQLLAEGLGVDVLNLGQAGAGPNQYLRHADGLEVVNRSSAVIVQVLSGRSTSNSYFENVNADLLRPWDKPEAKPQHAFRAYQALLERRGEAFVRQLVAESRENYVLDFTALLDAIGPPKILFWFSRRTPHYEEDYSSMLRVFGGFPQLVNAEMLERLSNHADRLVVCVTDRGTPQLLFDRLTGEPVPLFETTPPHSNWYYPSPEMHEDAASALLEPATNLRFRWRWRRRLGARARRPGTSAG